jgi:hypothetical protein
MLALVLLTLLLPRFAAASRPVIIPGREDEILSLLEPHNLGDELSPGWTLHSFSIEIATIELWIAGPEQAYAKVTLDHPKHAPPRAQETAGFALKIVDRPPGSEAAIDELVATLERNDDGSFWGRKVAHTDRQPFGLWSEIRDPEAREVWRWASDGIVLLGALTFALVLLVVHKLRGAEPWMKWTLLAIVLTGAALRLGLTPEAPLAPWSYTRFLISARLIYEGPLLGELHPEPVWMTDTILHSTLALSLLAPLSVYVHARYLLSDHRAALIVAGVLAFLPLHLRFSHSDAAFIPSITVSSFVFTLIHVAMREPNKWLGWLAVAVIGFPLALVYQVRPLNIMYFPLLIGTMFVNCGVYEDKPRVDRWRTGIVCVILTAVTFLGGVPWLLASYADKVGEGLQLHTLVLAAQVMFHPTMNALLNPVFTPPGLTLLALLGVVDLRRRGKGPLVWFLVLWLLGFLVAHAYFIPQSPYMQARYHLHLIVPFMLLAACGAEAALRWLASQRERHAWLAGRRYQAAIAALVAYVVASPLIHLHAVRYVEFNEVQEWRFVHSLRDEIPPECSVIEYVGFGASPRLPRVGSYTEGGALKTSWRVLSIPLDSHEANLTQHEVELPEDVRAALEDPPECLYWYEGLLCYGFKPPGLDKAPGCALIESFVDLEEVAATSFASVPYDEILAGGLEDADRVELRLYRARPRAR